MACLAERVMKCNVRLLGEGSRSGRQIVLLLLVVHHGMIVALNPIHACISRRVLVLVRVRVRVWVRLRVLVLDLPMRRRGIPILLIEVVKGPKASCWKRLVKKIWHREDRCVKTYDEELPGPNHPPKYHRATFFCQTARQMSRTWPMLGGLEM